MFSILQDMILKGDSRPTMVLYHSVVQMMQTIFLRQRKMKRPLKKTCWRSCPKWRIWCPASMLWLPAQTAGSASALAKHHWWPHEIGWLHPFRHKMDMVGPLSLPEKKVHQELGDQDGVRPEGIWSVQHCPGWTGNHEFPDWCVSRHPISKTLSFSDKAICTPVYHSYSLEAMEQLLTITCICYLWDALWYILSIGN